MPGRVCHFSNRHRQNETPASRPGNRQETGQSKTSKFRHSFEKIAIKSTPGLVRIEDLPWSCSLLGWISPRLSWHLEIVANNPYNYCKQLSQRCTNVNLWPCPCWGSPSVVNCRVGLHPDVQMELEIFASYIFTYIQQIHLNKISSKVNLWPCPVWAHPVLGLAEWDLTQMSRWV